MGCCFFHYSFEYVHNVQKATDHLIRKESLMTKMNLNSRILKNVLKLTGIVGLGFVGKTVFDYKKNKTNQSYRSLLLERLFGAFSGLLRKIESRTFYKKSLKVIGIKTRKYVDVPQFEGIKTSEVYVNNMQVLLFNDKKDVNQQVIFYLHGGAYVFQPNREHFNTVEDIIKKTDAHVVMPIYPKAPNHDYKVAYPKILEAYRKTISKTASRENITFVGDSAGGGLVVGLSSLLTYADIPQPRQLILISPWLDAASNNPNMKIFKESDRVSPSQTFLQVTGQLWAGGENDVYHPLVSPIYTKQITNLPPLYIIAGGDEMFYPDILRFQSYLLEAGIEVQLFIKDHMMHNYAIFRTPEGEEARNIISEKILMTE